MNYLKNVSMKLRFKEIFFLYIYYSKMNVFSANVKNVKLFKSLLSILKDILVDISFIITKNKIRIVSLDSSKEILLNINIDSENFEEYVCVFDKIIINTGAQNLYKIISKISNKSKLNLSIRVHVCTV